jgi:hypothetical protein
MIKTKVAKKKIGIKKKITKKKSIKKISAVKTLVKKEKAVKAEPAAVKAPEIIDVKMYPNKSYAEEYQVTGFHYAFVSKDNQMCHWWVKCRDFLQDALRNQLTGRVDQIYSFRYDPKSDPAVDTETTRMMVKRVPKPAGAGQLEFDEMMAAGLNIIHHYENKYGLKPLSKIVRVNHADYPVLFVGPGIWSQGPVMISIYTFFIRLGYWKPKFKDESSLISAYEGIINAGKQTNDTRYLKTVYKNLDKAFENMDKHLFKQKGQSKILFHDSPMSNFHHHSGIVSLSQFNTPVAELNNEFRKIFSGK